MSKSLRILKTLAKVPRGKVTTYGALAKKCGSSARAVGQVMRNNPRPDIYPCYKVVRSDGSIGGYDGCIKGKKVSKKTGLLIKDGIKIIDRRIDLKKYLHRF